MNKKIVTFIILLLIALMLFGCGENAGGDFHETDTEAETLTETAGETELAEPESFSVKYIRTGSYREGVDFPYAFTVGSPTELEDYITQNESEYYHLGQSEFGFAVSAYDEAFFADNMLVVAALQEGSGSIRHELVGVTADDVIQIKRLVPEAGTCDMAEWHVIIEMPRARGLGHSFTVEYYGEDKRELAVFSHNFVFMSARVPKGWSYEIKEYDESAGGYQQIGLEFYPEEAQKVRVKLFFSTEILGMCGTGLVSERITLGGYDAWHYRYEDMRDWHLYCFEGLPGEYSLEISGEDQAKYEADINGIIETIELFGGEYISKDEAIELAKNECTVEYDRVSAEFDFINGLWRVCFSKNMTAGGDQTVKLYINGKYHSSEYGE